ncbi:DegT/DnrJ/EryC1/StrS family aminotransferase [Candidatus Peregrinibacteria bacterium]|nr:DegT/DnrJ/EryC1/StrS family aminotransferase [Candidatus Peregrinibacteria bacterium]
MNLFSPIHHLFAPHVDTAYLLQTFKLFFTPWKWRRGPESELLRAELSKKLHGDVFLFSSGREAFLALLTALNLRKGDEVIVQRYTCIVVLNAIKAAKGVTVYADIDLNTLNLNIQSTEDQISNTTRAIICQHTFGIPSDTTALQSLCEQYDIHLIEDCAHVIPETCEADFAFFSFGRDKAISGISGGAILSRNPEISTKLKEIEMSAEHRPLLFIKRLLCYPLIYSLARPLYRIGIGKVLLKCAQILGGLVPIVSQKEKNGSMDPRLFKIPNACAALALFDYKRLHEKNDHRRMLTEFYLKEAQKNGWKFPSRITEHMPLQKFPIFVNNADEIRKKLKRRNIHLSDGWENCPGILNLPTHPTMSLKQAKNLSSLLTHLL